MADSDNSTLERFTPQLKTVVDMTTRTIKANSPLFILVSYQHNNDKQYFIEQLGKQLADNSLTMSCYDPKNNSQHEGVYRLMAEDSQKQRLSVVASMPEDEGFELDIGFVKYININRDNITRDNLRWLLFVKDHQMGDFINIAPDLWSFRIETLYLERAGNIDGLEDSFERVEPRADLDLMWRNVDVSFSQSSLTDEEKEAIAEHIAQSRELIEQTSDDLDKVRQLINLAEWLYRHDVYDLTREVAMEALTLLSNTSKSVASKYAIESFYYRLNNLIGNSYIKIGVFSYAIEYFNRSKYFVSEQSTEYIKVINQLAFCFIELGNNDNALSMAKVAVAFAKKSGIDSLVAESFYFLAVTYKELKQYKFAIEYHTKSLEIAIENQFEQLQANNHNGLANICVDEQKYAKAIEYYLNALDYFQKNGFKHSEIICLRNIGASFYYQNEYNQAHSYYIRARDLASNIRSLDLLAYALINLAQCGYKMSEYPQALKYAKEALPLLTQITSPEVDKTENLIKDLEQKLKEKSNS